MSFQEILHSGFSYNASGETRLTSANDALLACSPSGELCISVDVGSVQGIIPEFDLEESVIDDGATMTSITKGMVDGNVSETGRLKIERQSNALALTPDFSSIGASSYQLILFRKGEVVWQQSGVSGTAGMFNNFAARRRRACCRVIVYSFGNTNVAPFTLTNGVQVDADNAFFIPENAAFRVSDIRAIEIVGTGVKSLRLPSISVAISDPFITYRGWGKAALSAGSGKIMVNLGAGESGGVAAECGDVDLCSLCLSTEQCNENTSARLEMSADTAAIVAELPMITDSRHKLCLKEIVSPEAHLALELPQNCRASLSEERVEAGTGRENTMRSVQAALRRSTAL